MHGAVAEHLDMQDHDSLLGLRRGLKGLLEITCARHEIKFSLQGSMSGLPARMRYLLNIDNIQRMSKATLTRNP